MSAALALGYVPLVDAAPLLVAEALGFAEEEGLTLTLHPAPSWAALRDMLALGQVAAAQMLSPVPVAMALGMGGSAARFEALSVLNVNGEVFAVSLPMAARMRAAGHDFDFSDAMRAGHALLAAGNGALRIGVPFPFSMHVELVDYWLSGLDRPRPEGLEIISVPPPRMANALAAGEIDAFMVGEPWGSVAVEMGVADLLLPGSAIWAFAPEKILATRLGWAEAEPDLAGPLLRAIWRAGRWLALPGNHASASEILAAPGRLDVAPEVIERALSGRLVISPQGQEHRSPGFMEFHAGAATFPWRSQAAWIGMRMARRFGLDPVAAAKAASATFRSDLHRQHLAETGADLPGASEKLEGALDHPTPVASERGRLILPRDRFFDARIFDPDDPVR
jgi:ABC-type nitrate/sulfonate/bicarbonate transport system substrate-binding protein